MNRYCLDGEEPVNVISFSLEVDRDDNLVWLHANGRPILRINSGGGGRLCVGSAVRGLAMDDLGRLIIEDYVSCEPKL